MFCDTENSTPRQRKVHSLRKTLPQSQTILKIKAQASGDGRRDLLTHASRSPPLVSDATSYFDSPPTSSDELDTPPSTPPSSHVLLAHRQRKAWLSQSLLGYDTDVWISRKGSGQDEQPLTFTFSV
ncbi:hypothetical protein EI94DRAFT_1794768 [Lactarius quietus]|nr:hypothetical protein EI94DRAFT_1794768 [Lactarius quietus]